MPEGRNSEKWHDASRKSGTMPAGKYGTMPAGKWHDASRALTTYYRELPPGPLPPKQSFPNAGTGPDGSNRDRPAPRYAPAPVASSRPRQSFPYRRSETVLSPSPVLSKRPHNPRRARRGASLCEPSCLARRGSVASLARQRCKGRILGRASIHEARPSSETRPGAYARERRPPFTTQTEIRAKLRARNAGVRASNLPQ